jgi:Fe-S cluster biogenesis protein NfuA
MLTARRLLSTAVDSEAAASLFLNWRRTPNPRARELLLRASRKLLPRSESGRVIRLQASDPVVSDASPALAALSELLQVEPVSEVLVAYDRITVNLEPTYSWDQYSRRISNLVQRVLEQPMDSSDVQHLTAQAGATHESVDASWEDGSVEAEIVETLELHIRPHVREDGGDLRFIAFDHERGAVRVQLVGACSGCPSSAKTLQGRVEQLLKHFVPEVQSVESVSEDEAAAVALASAQQPGATAAAREPGSFGQEKVDLEEHMRRMMAEGEATSIVWDEAHRQPYNQPAAR